MTGEVRARLGEPEYQLVWPRASFIVEAAKLLDRRELKDWDDRCELLFDHAFVRGYEGGPLSEFRKITILSVVFLVMIHGEGEPRRHARR